MSSAPYQCQGEEKVCPVAANGCKRNNRQDARCIHTFWLVFNEHSWSAPVMHSNKLHLAANTAVVLYPNVIAIEGR